MITLAENAEQILQGESIYLIKIRSNIITYGFKNSFMMTWLVHNENNVGAILQKLDDNIIIHAQSRFDNNMCDELKAFLQIIGATNIFTDYDTAKMLGLNITGGGVIMKMRSYTSPVSSGFKPPPFPEYSKIYQLMKNSGLAMPEFDSFLSDISRRIKCKTSRIFANDDYTAAAFTAFEDENHAVISAVAVDEMHRKKGYGSGVLNSICASLKSDGKQIYLYRDKNKNEYFYLKNGFENIGEYVIAE